MATAGTPDPAEDFHHVRLDALRTAIEMYLAVAYPSGAIPEAVHRRLDWDSALSPDQLLRRPPFERVGRGTTGSPIVALRLGNTRYPHMKLQIQPWTSDQGFLLSVNTHDQVGSLDPNSPDADAFQALQAENQRIKEQIEQRWGEAGLPTFLGYLRDYIASQPGHPGPG